MKILLLLIAFILPLQEYAFEGENYFDINLGYKQGHYQRDVNLSVITTGEPAFLKINFKNLSIVNLAAKTEWEFKSRLYFRADAEYGWIQGGTTRRSVDLAVLQPDLLGVYNNSGHIANLQGGLGYCLLFLRNFSLSPIIGLGYNHQSLSAQDGSSTIFSNKITWIGPWFGCDASYHLFCFLNIDLQYAFHWVRCHDYHVDLPFGAASLDFKYDEALGNTLYLGLTHLLSKFCRLGLNFTYEWWKTLDSPDVSAVALVPFTIRIEDEQDFWSSWSVSAKIGYTF